MATPFELSFHLPILPSKEGSSQKAPSQYQCTIWPCHPLASCQTQIHSTLGSPSPDVITVSKPSRTLDYCPRLRIKYQGEIRTNKDASIQRWRSSFVLCPSSASQQHSGAFSDIVPDCHRCNHQMVARKTRPMASALRAPWSLSPNLQSQLKKFLRQWHLQMLDHQVPCHTPSFKTVFIKHSAVLDILCNHKQAIEDWSTSNPATCCCKSWSEYKTAAPNPSAPHWVLSGSLLHSLLSPELAVIAEGSLLNKVFPSKKEYFNQMRLAIKTWTKKNGLPSMPQASILELCHHLWSEHTQQVTNHITKSTINQLQSTFEGAIFHCEDKHASSLRIYCPCLYYQSIESTFQDQSIFEPISAEPSSIVTSLVDSLHRQHGKAYPWAVGSGQQLPAGYILAKRKKDFQSGRPIISFVESPFRPMLNILARLIFQLIPSACPDHFATGDVYKLLSILREAPVDADLILVNQDLAGFFTSIDQERFIRSWFMLLDFLRPKMNVYDDEVFSVYPGKSNNPGDIIKGRTFRRLNVTRKIIIKHVPDLIRSALDMQTFALGKRCVRQRRGSPMGSPLSPALCLMVVSSRFGPTPFATSYPTTICSFGTSVMLTIV